ncbi:hypothetical protein L596_008683 [Steinernema carpocapsae]|uniref:Uncharacterized protein n=1 Tax=Steinernema carpocapsae TaxID=34508 RepID=A0A4V6A6D4_STECR|nr:hypothetical protein L596_008683 [Steinernema carpocapsae]
MDCNSQLEKITRRKLRDLKRKRSGRCRSFSITRFRLERSLHLRRLMAQLLRRSLRTTAVNPYRILLPCVFQ